MATKMLSALAGSMSSSNDNDGPPVEKKPEHLTQSLGFAGRSIARSVNHSITQAPNAQQVGEGPVRIASNDNNIARTQITILSRIWSVLNRMSGTLSAQLQNQEEESLREREDRLEKDRIERKSELTNITQQDNKAMGAAIAGAIGLALAPLLAILGKGTGVVNDILERSGFDEPAPQPTTQPVPTTPGTPTPQQSEQPAAPPRRRRSIAGVYDDYNAWKQGGGLVGWVGRKTGAYTWINDHSQPQPVQGQTPTGQTVQTSSKGTRALTKREQALVDSISKYESNRDPYNAVYGMNKYLNVEKTYGKKLSDMTIAEVHKVQAELRRRTAGKIGKGDLGTSAVGKGQFITGTLKATLEWMAKKGWIPRDYNNLKYDAHMQNLVTAANAIRLGADPNRVEQWGAKQRRVISQQWEAFTGKPRRVNELVRNVSNAGQGQASPVSQPTQTPQTTPPVVGPTPETTAVPDAPSQAAPEVGAFREFFQGLFGGPMTAREGWARPQEHRDSRTPGLKQSIVIPPKKQGPQPSKSPIGGLIQEPIAEARKIVQQITNVVGGNKGQSPPVGIDSTGNVPSPSADMTTLSYQIYFSTGHK